MPQGVVSGALDRALVDRGEEMMVELERGEDCRFDESFGEGDHRPGGRELELVDEASRYGPK
ncbi:hypothetical protein [Janibacter alittae]|uniref:Uncharacterized protein n=1 Tax=Janibacter alittae TaxID=3115209 RepID=A0ABZ2MM13_9MICO